MSRRSRRNHSPEFKAKVALAAVRNEGTLADWLALVRGLVTDATVVVVYFPSFSEGLLKEVDLIRDVGAQQKTVLVVGRKLKAKGAAQDAFAGFEHVLREASGAFDATLHAALAAASGRVAAYRGCGHYGAGAPGDQHLGVSRRGKTSMSGSRWAIRSGLSRHS